jgi:hypothetical protein
VSSSDAINTTFLALLLDPFEADNDGICFDSRSAVVLDVFGLLEHILICVTVT